VQKMAQYALVCLIMGPFKRGSACFVEIMARQGGAHAVIVVMGLGTL